MLAQRNQQGWDGAVRGEHQVILAAVAGAVASARRRKVTLERQARSYRRIEALESALKQLEDEVEQCRAQREAVTVQLGTLANQHATDIAVTRFQAEAEMTQLTETHEGQVGRLEMQLRQTNERLDATRHLLESQDQAVGTLRADKARLEERAKEVQEAAEREAEKELLRLRVGMDEAAAATARAAGEREASLRARLAEAEREMQTCRATMASTQGDLAHVRQELARKDALVAEGKKECDELRKRLQDKVVVPFAVSQSQPRPRSRPRPSMSASSGSQLENIEPPPPPLADDDDDEIIVLDEDPRITNNRRPPPPVIHKPNSKRDRPVEDDAEMLKRVARQIVGRSYTKEHLCQFCL